MKIKCPYENCGQEIDTLGKEIPYFEELLLSRFSKICFWLSRLTRISFINKIGSKFSKNSITTKCPSCNLFFELSQDGQVGLTNTAQRVMSIENYMKVLASHYSKATKG